MEPLVTMTGRVGHSPDLRTTRNGVECTHFRLAHTPRIPRDGGWVDGETTWVTVQCYRQLAANVCRSIRRGDPVVVTGRLSVAAWVDEQTNAQRESITIDARSVGHDMAFGSTHFTRVKPEKAEEGEEAEESGEGAEATADSEASGLSVVPDSPADLVTPSPF
ncbi:single-stranded DNA-binding protein [Mariniluteicoccus flavus]